MQLLVCVMLLRIVLARNPIAQGMHMSQPLMFVEQLQALVMHQNCVLDQAQHALMMSSNHQHWFVAHRKDHVT